jgi:hypothetical protein
MYYFGLKVCWSTFWGIFFKSSGLLFFSQKYQKIVQLQYGVARWYFFKPKSPNLGTFWGVLQSKMLVNFKAI